MCYLQGSSTGVTMIKTSCFLYSLPMLPSDAFKLLYPPRKSNFWVLYFGHCLSRTHGGPASSFLNCIWIWVEVNCHQLWSESRNLRVCKALQIVCLRGFVFSPKQSQPRNIWNGHGVPCQTLPSAKFHCFRALDVLKFEWTPLEFV